MAPGIKSISERKQIEDDLRQNQLALLRSQRMAHVGNWTFDPVSLSIEWSEEMYCIFGLDPAGPITFEQNHALIHPDDRQRFEAAVGQALQTTNPFEIELRIVHRDGTVREIGPLFPFVRDAAKFALSGGDVSCSFEAAEGLWQCDFDRGQIGQVIDNIVLNARQAMPGGGMLEISAKNVTLGNNDHFVNQSASAEAAGPVSPAGEAKGSGRGTNKFVKISIKDSGIGMPKELLPRIFDPFFTTKATGHGLGLATCHSIVGRHDGHIEVESEPGKGSTFHLYLPAAAGDGRVEAEGTSAKHNGAGIFLVMDDAQEMQDTVGNMLELMGYTAVCRENGKEAIAFVSEEIQAGRHIAGMLFDLTIPGGMGGRQALSEIRKVCPVTPVFVMSGYAKDPVMADPEKYGFTASICKPFRRMELAKLLNKYFPNGAV